MPTNDVVEVRWGMATDDEKARAYYMDLLDEFRPQPKSRRPDFSKKTATVMSFNIGLFQQGDTLHYDSTPAETIDRLTRILETFYGEPTFE